MKQVVWTGAKEKPFVPSKPGDSSELNLPESKRTELFNERFKQLLDGAQQSNPSQEKPWWYSLRKEPEKKE